MNRSKFIIRQLKFYEKSNFKGKIFIGDSSDELHKETLSKNISSLDIKESIRHFSFPNKSCAEVTVDMLKKVETPYVSMIGDDDLYIPSSLDKCVNFLEENSDYVAAHGKSFAIGISKDKDFGKIVQFESYNQPIIEDENALKRVYNLFKNYSTPLFCVHRTEAFIKAYSKISSYEEPRFHKELVPSLILPIFGKYKELDNIFMFRQFHLQRYLLPQIEDWILDKRFFIEFDLLKNDIHKSINDKNITYDDVSFEMNKAMSNYINQSFTKENCTLIIKKFIAYKLPNIIYDLIKYKLLNKGFNRAKYNNCISSKSFKIAIDFIENN